MKIRYSALLINSHTRKPLNGGYDTSMSALVAMFAHIYTLPDSQVKNAISNRHTDTATQ